MSTPNEVIKQAADELRMNGLTGAADYVEANSPENNPSLWEGNDSDTILRQLIEGRLEEYRNEIEGPLTSLLEQSRAEAAEAAEAGGAATAPGDRFGWVRADQREQLEAALGPSWESVLGDRLDEGWGSGWEQSYDDAQKAEVLDQWIPALAMPFSGLTDEEFDAYINEVNTDLWNEMLNDDLMKDFEEHSPGITAELYHLLSGELTEIAREGLAEQRDGA